jgi:predicted nucleotide-binding protein
MPKGRVSAGITAFRTQADDLLASASGVADEPTAESWRHSFERWRSAAREFLQNAYTTDGPASEFFSKARRPSVARVGRPQWRDRHSRLVENLKEADNVLASLLERLALISDGPGLDSAAMPTRLRRPRPEVEAIIDRGIESATNLLSAAEDVRDAATYESWVHDLERWHALTRDALLSAYEGDEAASEFYDAATGRIFRQMGQSEDETFRYYQEATSGAINTLRSLRERLEYAEAPTTDEARAAEREAGPLPRRVFVVHGRDEALREQVARVLERLGFEALVLMEQPGRGQTLIEKFEAGALDVGFAVVLLTPDDFGRGPDEAEWPEQPNRARQNVILELGYFMGRLGRPRVAALYGAGTEIPSDIHGLAYVALDDGGAWKYRLAEELAAAGYDVDMNRLRA